MLKIQSEQQQLDSKQKTSQININKCWNIIRFICDSQDYFAQNIDQLELAIQPLLQCIQYSDKIEFEDDIILAISALIKKRKEVTESTLLYLQYFGQVFLKQEKMMGQMLQCLNNYLQYGQYIFTQNPAYLNPVSDSR